MGNSRTFTVLQIFRPQGYYWAGSLRYAFVMANKKLEIFELEDGNAEEEMAAVKARITLKDVKDARIVVSGGFPGCMILSVGLTHPA